MAPALRRKRLKAKAMNEAVSPGLEGVTISASAAKRLNKILKGEAGIGGPKRTDPLFDDAVQEFVAWATTNRKARTAADYAGLLRRLTRTFGGRRLSQLDELSIERATVQRWGMVRAAKG